ncbi:hypothetical protein F66182_1562 [Fusarium sp. NRRL 66182]|nr:hypothetical protein F66182_1562 [Fusarium sp. NRRL 66182]
MSRLDVSFPTLDGLSLRGWLYPASKRGPGIIISPGFNMPKEAFVPDIAQWYQKHDVTALVFDNRTYGTSDGEPRQDTSPRKRVEDFHDAVTYISGHELVDPDKIALWGLCFDGNMCLAATALDPRVHAVISVAPVIDLHGFPERRRAMLELAMQDRAGRLSGQGMLYHNLFPSHVIALELTFLSPLPSEPIYLPYINEDGSIPLGPVMGADFMPLIARLKVPVENRVTVQSFYNAYSWDIMTLIGYVSPTPAMMVTPENDIECPAEQQINAFAKMGEPKTFHLLPGKGHLDWAFGDVDSVLNKQLEFLRGALNF